MKIEKKKRRWAARYAAPVVLLSALTLGCGSSNNDFVFLGNTPPVQTVNTGNLAVQLQLAQARAVPVSVDEIRVDLIQNNQVVLSRNFDRQATGTEQTILIEDIAPGDYTVRLSYFGNGNDLIGTFETTVTIVAGQETVIDDPDFQDETFLNSRRLDISLPDNSVPMPIKVADFNEDGALDIVVGSQDEDLLYLILSDGNGGFEAPVQVTNPNLNYLRDIQVADINEDENLDVLVANWSNNNFTVFLGNGDGTFDGGTAISNVDSSNITQSPHSISVGDFNGDENLDVLTDHYQEISVFLGDGNGGFTFNNDIDLPNPDDWSFRIINGDWNGDQDLDLAYCSWDGRVGFALGNGDGTFAAPTVLGDYNQPFSLTSGDIDNDGDLDIISANLQSQLPIFRNDGNGNFTESSYSSEGPVSWVELADMNGDGNLDLVYSVRGEDAIYTAIGNGDGTFAPSRSRLQAPRGPFNLTIGDMDGNGHLDIISANRGDYGGSGQNSGNSGPNGVTIFFGD